MEAPAFQAAHPDYARIVRETFEAQPFMRHIGVQLVSVTPGRAEFHLPHQPALMQQHGFFHGGLIATLLDTACGAAVYSLLPADRGALTVEFKVNIMAPGQGERLVARAQVVRAGRTLTVCRADIFAVSGGRETPCATGLMTAMAIAR